MQRRLAMLLILAMLLFALPLTGTAEASAADGPATYAHDGRVTLIDGATVETPVTDFDAAKAVVDGVLDQLGGDERTVLDPWRVLTDAKGNNYYVFQQMCNNTTVLGGAVKVITDAEGGMLALTSSIVNDLPEADDAEPIAAEQAEQIVLDRYMEENQRALTLVEGATARIILPLVLEIDMEAEDEDTGSRYVWVVYTDNPDAAEPRSSDLPWLAHYVTMSGEYLYSLPTMQPGDEVGATGFDASYVFDFMEPVNYAGAVKLSTGDEMEISINLMRDARTGVYYLGNMERRIVVADFYETVYNHNMTLVSSTSNDDWDPMDLLALYNYCRAWDYYNEIGWVGGDGRGRPIMILKGFCTSDHTPVDNAAYAGTAYAGWEMFLASDINDYSQCLDVLGHEFTHCVTGNVMTYAPYLNDYGAINEAMSDIQGNLCEMLMGATEDDTWLIAENSENKAIRSMSDPHARRQPEYTWDIYYATNVKSPTVINDLGGVHNNSSLLAKVAYKLCAEGGMSLEDARAFWFAVDCAMVPGTDYAQLSELMPVILRAQGLDDYLNALEAAMDATRLRSNDLPDTFDADRALLTVTLPDDERFQDGNWMMAILSINPDQIFQVFEDAYMRRGESAGLLDDLLTIIGLDPALLPTREAVEANAEQAWTASMDAINAEIEKLDYDALLDADENAFLPTLKASLMQLYDRYFKKAFYFGTGSAGQDGRTVRMVGRPGYTVPVLFRLEVDNDLNVLSGGLAVYAMGQWNDLSKLITEMAQPEQGLSDLAKLGGLLGGDDSDDGDLVSALLGGLLSGDDGSEADGGDMSMLFDLLGCGLPGGDDDGAEPFDMSGFARDMLKAGVDWVRDEVLYQVRGGEVNEIPSTGLEDVLSISTEEYPFLSDMFNQMKNDAGDEVTVDYGVSGIYAQADMDAAIALIKARIATWDGVALHSVRYAGDEANSDKNLAMLNDLQAGQSYTQCIEFFTDLHSPVRGGGAWMPDREYTDWQWWLARTEGGDWQIVSWGY